MIYFDNSATSFFKIERIVSWDYSLKKTVPSFNRTRFIEAIIIDGKIDLQQIKNKPVITKQEYQYEFILKKKETSTSFR